MLLAVTSLGIRNILRPLMCMPVSTVMTSTACARNFLCLCLSPLAIAVPEGERRALDWDLGQLPVPAEILVYPELEWEKLMQAGGRFARMLQEEAVWL